MTKLTPTQVEDFRNAVATDLGVLLEAEQAEVWAHMLLAYALVLHEESLPAISL